MACLFCTFHIYLVVGFVHTPGRLFLSFCCDVSQKATRLAVARLFPRSSRPSTNPSLLFLSMSKDNEKDKSMDKGKGTAKGDGRAREDAMLCMASARLISRRALAAANPI
jgi:hypothetical protein